MRQFRIFNQSKTKVSMSNHGWRCYQNGKLHVFRFNFIYNLLKSSLGCSDFWHLENSKTKLYNSAKRIANFKISKFHGCKDKQMRLFFISDLAIGIYKEKEGEITILHCCKNCCLIPNRQYVNVIPRSSNLWCLALCESSVARL